ncbi:MAG TPA: hypothetical protein VMV50_02755 [Candidatus Paceibacterota bacterium]|nr:hypothetical protein [Candidatus Paceibacterota bacterium]
MASVKRRGEIKERHIKLDSYTYKGAKRKNNPPVGLVSSATDQIDGATAYKHDPHIDPRLSWAGKEEAAEINVRNISLHIHERIDPERMARGFLKRLDQDAETQQLSLFQLPENEPPLAKDINFVNGKTPAFSLRSPFDTILSFANQPTGLNITDDFRTIDWPKEYPAPEFTIGQIKALLAQ